jgi:hypothetical protein
MDEFSHVLALLRAWAADHLRRAPSGKKPEIANKTTERAFATEHSRSAAACKAWRHRNDPDTSTGLSAACSPTSRHG